MRPLLERAMRLAIALEHPAYDCMYLALAGAQGCDFVTADGVLSRKVLPRDVTANIILLSEIGRS
jgi:predicted nucleic acid-binding protein